MKHFFQTLSNLRHFAPLMFLLVVFINCETASETPDDTSNEIKPEERLPQISINTNGVTILDDPKIEAQITISKEGESSYQGKVGIELRGSSSQLFPKKSYGFETWNDNQEGIDVPLLGLPEEEDWILYGPYSDKTFLRNVLIYDLSREIGQYASRGIFTELTLNGSYQGVYVLMEKLKRDKQRININKLDDDENSGEDLTGGYILKIDKSTGDGIGQTDYNDVNSFISNYTPNNATAGQHIYFLYEEPSADDITPEQKNYISAYVHSFEDALAGDNFTDPATGYAAYIDVQSFIDFFLLNELANNVDAYRLSTFMHKDKNGKLKMGPIWDFNIAFGNANYCNGGNFNSWAYKFNEVCPQDFWLVPFWWERLLQDPAFVSNLKERWNLLRASTFSQASILDKIDGYKESLKKSGAVDTNYQTWNILGTYIWPNNFIGNTYAEETDYLEDWIINRLTWMDSAINNL